MKKFSFIWIVILIFAIPSCQNNDDSTVTPPNNNNNNNGNNGIEPTDTKHIVTITNNEFNPKNLTINVGDTVVWTNNGSVIHTATSGDNCSKDEVFNSGNISPGKTFSFKFTDEGDFDYFCIPHCSMGMVGKITVDE